MFSVIGFFFAGLAPVVHATVYTWTGAAVDDAWDSGPTITNWDQGAGQLPTSSDSVAFDASATGFTVNLAGNRTVTNVSFAGGEGYTLNQDSLTISASSISVDDTLVSHRINSNVILDSVAEPVWDIGTDANLVIAGHLTAPKGLVKTGTGKLAIVGNSSFGGILNVQGGAVAISKAFSANIQLDAGRLELASSYSGNVSFSGTCSIDVASVKNFTPGTLSSSSDSTLQFTGPGNVSLIGGNLYSGVTDVQNGSLYVTNATGSATGDSEVIIRAPATLGGNGVITGRVTIQEGGKVRPVEQLTTGSLSMAGQSRLFIDVDTPSLYEKLVVNGPVTLGAFGLTLLLDYAPSLGDTFIVIDNDGAEPIITDSTTPTLCQATYNGKVYSFQINYTGGDGNDVSVTLITGYEHSAQMAGLSGPEALPEAKPFLDGLPNVVKYGFAISLDEPATDTRANLPKVELLSTGILRVEYRRSNLDAFISYTPRFSAQIDSGWSNFTTLPVVTSGIGTDLVVYEEPVDLVASKAYFVEVEVEVPTP